MNQRVAIALSSLFAGSAGGGAVGAAITWLASKEYQFMSFAGDPANLVYVGTPLGAVLAATIGWRLSAAVDVTWQRAALSVLAGLGGMGAGSAAYGVWIYSMMIPSALLSALLLPCYVLLLVAIWFGATSLARRVRGPAPGRTSAAM